MAVSEGVIRFLIAVPVWIGICSIMAVFSVIIAWMLTESEDG